MVRVLGVDPGSRVLGVGILDVGPGSRVVLVHAGVIRPPQSPLPARLEVIFRELTGAVALYRPEVLAIECVFHGKNFQSVLKLGEARGVVVLVAQMSGLGVAEYPPSVIKRAATGNGNAEKGQVQSMMQRILSLAEKPEPEDTSDALAVAFCHAQRLWKVEKGLAPVDGAKGRTAIDLLKRSMAARGKPRAGKARKGAGGSGNIAELLSPESRVFRGHRFRALPRKPRELES